MSRDTSLAIALGPRQSAAIAICSTISKDNTAGEDARQADLFAHLGRKTRPAFVQIHQQQLMRSSLTRDNEEKGFQPVGFDSQHSLGRQSQQRQQQGVLDDNEDNDCSSDGLVDIVTSSSARKSAPRQLGSNIYAAATRPIRPSRYYGQSKLVLDLDCDYYGDLELPGIADVEAVRQQFRKLSLRYHPDRNPGRVAEVILRFKAIQTANEILMDPAQKAKYDAHLKRNLPDDESDSTRERAAPLEIIFYQPGAERRRVARHEKREHDVAVSYVEPPRLPEGRFENNYASRSDGFAPKVKAAREFSPEDAYWDTRGWDEIRYSINSSREIEGFGQGSSYNHRHPDESLRKDREENRSIGSTSLPTTELGSLGRSRPYRPSESYIFDRYRISTDHRSTNQSFEDLGHTLEGANSHLRALLDFTIPSHDLPRV